MIWVRLAVTIFVAAILAIVAVGWQWTGANQPPTGALASRIVLGLAAVAALIALVSVWRGQPSSSRRSHA
jgi:hypothetical protein